MARRPDSPVERGPVRPHQRALDALARRGRLRRLAPQTGIDFTSNDYLGLAASVELREAAREALSRGVPLGAGGSRLLRGNHPEHEALEAEAATFFGSETALYFGSGFAANAALLATLPAHGDLIIHDALIHASAWDGMANTKAATLAARHNDVGSFADGIAGWRQGGGTGRVWIAVESLYSMDGDCAPLADLAALAGRVDAMLLIDEAHATGVLGPQGRGLGAHLEGRDNVVTLHTCGKALGASGALICGPAAIRDFLINRARAFIYATAPSPVMAAVVRRALMMVATQPERRQALSARVAFAADELQRTCGLAASGTHIMPVIIGGDAGAVSIAEAMQRAGYDIRAIRPPTVPDGTARLRITLTLNTDAAQLTPMLETLGSHVAGRLGQHRAPTSAMQPPLTPTLSPLECRQWGEGVWTPPRFVITGTGTGVGKTVVAAALAQALDADYWKPVQAGLDGPTDTQRVMALSGLPPERFHAEAYRLATPASPHYAAALEGVVINPDSLIPPPTTRALIIEGAGGLMVPLTAGTLMIDLFARWQLPVILVAGTQLGTINHTLLSLEALRARGIAIHGVAFVGEDAASSRDIIKARGKVRDLGRLPMLADLSPDSLRAAFAAHFDIADFSAPPVGAIRP